MRIGIPIVDRTLQMLRTHTHGNDMTSKRISSITISQLNFVPLESAGDQEDIVATINASTEGLSIVATLLNITGTTTFANGNNLAQNINAGVTTISGGKITTGSITATQIAASTITGSKIAAGTITATNLAADSVTATKIDVTTLSAISANLGTITAGTMSAVSISAATITGSILQTGTSGSNVNIVGDRIYIRYGTTNKGYFQGTSSTAIISLGLVRFDVGGGKVSLYSLSGNNFYVTDHGGTVGSPIYAGPLYPLVNNSYDLGSSSYKYKNLYLSGDANIDVDVTASGVFPPTDDGGSAVGNASKRWSLIRGVAITSGDLGFEEKYCASCGENFNKHDAIILKVMKVLSDEIRTVPIHLSCANTPIKWRQDHYSKQKMKLQEAEKLELTARPKLNILKSVIINQAI